MADQVLVTAGRVEVVQMWEPLFLIAGVAITAGDGIIFNASGEAILSNGTTDATAKARGIATQTAAKGMPVTAMKSGILAGFTLTGDFGSDVYVSDTDGKLGSSAGTKPGIVGYVGVGNANLLGESKDKLLVVNL